jgi:hypothetical protein
MQEPREARTRRRLIGFASVLVLTLAFVLVSAVPAWAADHWTDITDAQWIKTYGITAAQVATVAQGYENGAFRPSQTVTRAQYAKMVLSALNIPPDMSPTPSFSDVSAKSYYYPWIEGGVTAGVISAQGDATYRPADPTTRQEAGLPLAAFLAQEALNVGGGISGRLGIYQSLDAYFAAEGPSLLAGFADDNTLSPDCAPSGAYLVFLGVVRGSGDGGAVILGPTTPLTRAQAVALILRAERYTPKPARPQVGAVAPAFGLDSGGTEAIISGSGFSRASSVQFGSVTLGPGDFSVRSDSEIDIPATPAGTGCVDVTVTNDLGKSLTSKRDVFTYVAALGPGDEVVQIALTHLGAPYLWGGAGPSAFDCSGLVLSVYAQLGYPLPHHAASQYPLGTPIPPGEPLEAGDLVFFGNPVYHVGIYVGDGNMIDAPHTGSYVRLESMAWSDYSGACRILVDPAQTGLAPVAIVRHEQTDPRLTYSGDWTTSATASASGGGFAYANSEGASVTIRFTGTNLVWIAKMSSVYGKAKVTIDGGSPATVDLYSADVVWRQKVWDSGTLADGTHIVKIEWTGAKSPAATDTNINIDAVDVTGTLN